ncbi:MAG: hypothetical protein J6I45_08935 [Clostridia bacterium]|nr:hypothetical protein [Clostridia bacterium]
MERYAIGLDIGTTGISAVLIDADSGRLCRTVSETNGSFIESEHPWEFIQDTEIIARKALAIIEDLTSSVSGVCAIGVTGQMHGILYLNGDGRAISPLYTWQDQRAENKLPSGKTACEEIREITGYTVHAGYGLATHYANLKLGLVPKGAVSFCTIHDYIVMLLTGRKTPLTHTSDAASLGIYNLKHHRFDIQAVESLGISPSMLPEVTSEEMTAGYFNGIPVSCAIGDNQAAFLGSVADMERGMIINIGTGSQLSYVTDYCEDRGECELRPLAGGKYIMAGSALCGGRAYAIMERFIRALSAESCQESSAYALMEKLAREAPPDCGGIAVDTRFAGSRSNPSVRGSVSGIDTANFTPGNLIRATLCGMVDELHAYAKDEIGAAFLVGSGNAIRRNVLLAEIIEERFGCRLMIPKNTEEASLGTALFGMVAGGICASFDDCAKFIDYTRED